MDTKNIKPIKVANSDIDRIIRNNKIIWEMPKPQPYTVLDWYYTNSSDLYPANYKFSERDFYYSDCYIISGKIHLKNRVFYKTDSNYFFGGEGEVYMYKFIKEQFYDGKRRYLHELWRSNSTMEVVIDED